VAMAITAAEARNSRISPPVVFVETGLHFESPGPRYF
jgi:hypothetical protein